MYMYTLPTEYLGMFFSGGGEGGDLGMFFFCGGERGFEHQTKLTRKGYHSIIIQSYDM